MEIWGTVVSRYGGSLGCWTQDETENLNPQESETIDDDDDDEKRDGDDSKCMVLLITLGKCGEIIRADLTSTSFHVVWICECVIDACDHLLYSNVPFNMLGHV